MITRPTLVLSICESMETTHPYCLDMQTALGPCRKRVCQVKSLYNQPGVQKAVFEQCYFGLRAPSGKYLKKKTCILTNSTLVFNAFNGKCCPGGHTHQRIEGSEEGKKRSALAQTYPPDMISAIASAMPQSHVFKLRDLVV